jgi:predicted ribosomally synthesized peptide with nif11-like leader
MSKENVKLFYEALARDKGLQERFDALNRKYGGQKLDEAQMEAIYQKELIPLAKEAGYNFTMGELKEYARMSQKPVTRELSEDELATVAGGFCDAVKGWGYYCAVFPGSAQPF